MADRQRTLFGEPLFAWIALAAGVVAVCGHSATAYTIPVMMKSILAELGWTRGEFASAHAARTIGIGLSGLVWGLLTDRMGARAVLVAGAVLSAAGIAGFAGMQSIAHFWGVGLVIGVGIGGLGPIAASTLIARSFGPLRGFALGVLHAGDNLLTSFLPAATTTLAAALGWRAASGIFAACYLVIGVLVFACLPGGGDEPGPRLGRRIGLRDVPWRHPVFVLTALSFVVAYAWIGSIIYHFIPYQTDLGISEAVAAAAMAKVVLAGFGGALLAGVVAERFRASRVLFVMHALLALAAFVLWRTTDATALRAWPWLHGFAMGAYAPLMPLVLAEHFGAQAPNLGTTIGAVSVVALTGAFVGNLAGGVGFDVSGSYVAVWRGFAIALFFSLALPWALDRRRAPAIV